MILVPPGSTLFPYTTLFRSCVVKLAGHERRLHRGPARVFDSEAACFEAVKERRIVSGDVVVIRYEGPVGGPGMQDRKSTRLNSSHLGISYAVFCLKKKKTRY